MAIRIFIDQGHNPGGINGGAVGFGINEQDVTFNVGMYLADLLREDPRFEVRTSRQTITEIIGTSNATSLRNVLLWQTNGQQIILSAFIVIQM